MNRNESHYRESYRPRYHFTPEVNWLSDPNGLVYYQGEYHLFYQHYPFRPLWGPTHWGHAVSRDLVHWEQLPLALKPDELGYIFSGSVVVDRSDSSGFFDGGSGLVAIYTSARKRGKDDYLQRQSIAFSWDRGRSWEKFEGNPVIENPGLEDFRDPKVFWYGAERKWVMVVSRGQQVGFFESRNLREWTFLSEFGRNFGSRRGTWECPDLFTLSPGRDLEKWVLVVGDQFGGEAGGSRIQYFVGDFDGSRFTPDHQSTNASWVDYGQDFYAAQTWNNLLEERRLAIGWLSNLHYSEAIPSQGWRGAMSIPREFDLARDSEGFRLVQQPISELTRLRKESHNWKGLKISEDSPFSPDLSGGSLEINVVVQLGPWREFGLRLRKAGDQETVAGYSAEDRELFVDRTRSGKTDFSQHFLGKHVAPLEPDGGRVELEIFLDRSSIEVFGNGGRRTISDLIFPKAEGKELELYVKGGELAVPSLEIHKLSSIWR